MITQSVSCSIIHWEWQTESPMLVIVALEQDKSTVKAISFALIVIPIGMEKEFE